MIKIKDIEGDAKEISDLFENQGFNLSSYLDIKPQKQKPHKWAIPICVTLFLLACSIVWIDCFDSAWTKVIVVMMFALIITLVYLVHLHHEQTMLTTIVAIGGLLLLLLCLNVFTPQELVKDMKQKTENKLGIGDKKSPTK